MDPKRKTHPLPTQLQPLRRTVPTILPYIYPQSPAIEILTRLIDETKVKSCLNHEA